MKASWLCIFWLWSGLHEFGDSGVSGDWPDLEVISKYCEDRQ